VAEQAAAALRAAGDGFADVGAAFLTAPPAPAEALAGLRGDPVCVVPMFMAEGYFMRAVLPKALAHADPGRRRLILAPPLGVAPDLTAVIERRAVAHASDVGFVPAQTTLLLVGHGTERDPASREAVRFHAGRLAAWGRFARVEIALLEEEPRIATQLAACAGDMVALGFFAGPGMHAGEDVPQALAADPRRGERRLGYAGPIGAAPDIAVILGALARTALAAAAAGRG
jgi:sirohydrochlorin cobaltochelatase